MKESVIFFPYSSTHFAENFEKNSFFLLQSAEKVLYYLTEPDRNTVPCHGAERSDFLSLHKPYIPKENKTKMKKTIFSLAAAAGLFLAGCTSVESTQNFNGIACGTPTEKATCQILIQIPGYYFLGLPLITGDLADGKFTFFTYTQTTDNAVWMLTKEAKGKGATRIINQNITMYESFVPFPFMSKQTMVVSATGVRSRTAALRQARDSYDREP